VVPLRLADAITEIPEAPAAWAVLGVIAAIADHSVTVHVRRGARMPEGSDGRVTYQVSSSGTRVYKGERRAAMEDLAVGDLVLVHALVIPPADGDEARATAARIHGLTPSRSAARA
jgi:hypothetical protein